MLIKALGTYDKKDNSYLENFLLETLNANLFLVLKKKMLGNIFLWYQMIKITYANECLKILFKERWSSIELIFTVVVIPKHLSYSSAMYTSSPFYI